MKQAMTVAQMQVRIKFLKDAASVASDFLIYSDATTFESRTAFFGQYVYPTSKAYNKAAMSRTKHAEIAALLEQAEVLTREAIRAAYEIQKGDVHYVPVEKFVESVQAYKAELYAFVKEIVAELESPSVMMVNLYAVLDATKIDAIEVNELSGRVEIVTPMSKGGFMYAALKAAGYAVEVSEDFPGTFYVKKFTASVHKPEQALKCSTIMPEPTPKLIKTRDAGLMSLKDVPLYVKEILFTKVQAAEGPYMWSLRGTPGGKISTHDSAIAAFDKLRKWCESIGSEVRMVTNGFRNPNVMTSKACLIVEITDPAARFIEQFLEQVHGKHWKDSKPKSGYDWRYYKEVGKA